MWCKRAFKRCLGKSGNGAFYKRVVRKRGAKKKQTIAEKKTDKALTAQRTRTCLKRGVGDVGTRRGPKHHQKASEKNKTLKTNLF